jgi:hypothetical protein
MKLATKMLRNMGYQPSCAYDGDEAVQMVTVEKQHFDVIFMDMVGAHHARTHLHVDRILADCFSCHVCAHSLCDDGALGDAPEGWPDNQSGDLAILRSVAANKSAAASADRDRNDSVCHGSGQEALCPGRDGQTISALSSGRWHEWCFTVQGADCSVLCWILVGFRCQACESFVVQAEN